MSNIAIFIGGPYDGKGMLVRHDDLQIILPVQVGKTVSAVIDFDTDMLPMVTSQYIIARYDKQILGGIPKTKVILYTWSGTFD